MVVICLQNVSLMCWVTTKLPKSICEKMLWFAYKMYLWCVELQPCELEITHILSCDLLTKCIFDVLSYNIDSKTALLSSVVICLQNVSLMCWVTTGNGTPSQTILLWFAYKMYLWCVELQLFKFPEAAGFSCDLLTKCIFDVLSYNNNTRIRVTKSVVICLQNVSLMCWVTT